mmetsp:Transcript_81364/g.158943  ORF Transcript_81364/g.158943 Transcript_81364/m.158943 type:complete len:396 (+) Transcript_81364:117-1304(+)
MVEMSAYMLLMYLPYFVAEAVEMSGIVATLFAGITCRHYAHQNLSTESQDEAQFLFKLAAFVCETAVFLDLGLSVFQLDYRDDYHSSLIAWSLLLCLVSRALHVYPLSSLLNRSRERHQGRIEPKQQHVLWFSGLRGAVAFACAQVFPDSNGHRETFLITTMMVVLCTVFTMGCATVPLLKHLQVDTGVDEESYEAPPPSKYTMTILEFDRRHILPVLTNYRPGGEWVREESIRRRAEAREQLLRRGGLGGGGVGGVGDAGEEEEDGQTVDFAENPLALGFEESNPTERMLELRNRGAASEEGAGGVTGDSDVAANDGSGVSPPVSPPEGGFKNGGHRVPSSSPSSRFGTNERGGYERPSEDEGGSEDDLVGGGRSVSPEKRPPWGDNDGDTDIL